MDDFKDKVVVVTGAGGGLGGGDGVEGVAVVAADGVELWGEVLRS